MRPLTMNTHDNTRGAEYFSTRANEPMTDPCQYLTIFPKKN